MSLNILSLMFLSFYSLKRFLISLNTLSVLTFSSTLSLMGLFYSIGPGAPRMLNNSFIDMLL